MSLELAIKLLAAPVLIGLASLAGKRWGPNAAGLVGGLPLVGGPVVLALWLSDGAAAATRVSLAAPTGLWATMIYLLVLGHASARWRWHTVIALGWACYLAAAVALHASGLARSGVPGIAVIPALWLAATRWLPRPAGPRTPVHLPRVELAARMLAAVALVWSLTAAADLLGPEMTGVLSGAPVAATVIPAFTFANAGRDPLLLALRGFLTGLTGFAAFFLVLGNLIARLGAMALVPALAAAAIVGLLATRLVRQAIPAPGTA